MYEIRKTTCINKHVLTLLDGLLVSHWGQYKMTAFSADDFFQEHFLAINFDSNFTSVFFSKGLINNMPILIRIMAIPHYLKQWWPSWSSTSTDIETDCTWVGWVFHVTWGPFYQHGLTFILTWISNHTHREVWDEITYQFPNFNVEVWDR